MNYAFDVFSPQQWHVLQALAVYRLLTVEQMLHLGLSKNAKSLRDKSLFALRHHGCIQSEKIGSFLPDVHHLTAKGAEVIRELEGRDDLAAPSPKRQPFSALFAAHRFAQVDAQIGFREWVAARGDVDIMVERQDFVRTPRPATELKVPGLESSVIPDGIFAVERNTGQQAVYLVEVHRATQSKAIAAQLSRYFAVIQSGAMQQTFDLSANPTICSVHQNEAVLKSVKMRLLALPEFERFKQNFVFRRLDDLRQNFRLDWHLADDTAAEPFPLLNPKHDG